MISQELELQGSGTKAPVLAPKGPRLPGKEARGRASAQKGRPLPAASEQAGAGTAAPARGVARSALLPSLGRDPRTHHPIHRRSHGVRFQKRTPWGSETLDLGRKEVGTPGARTDRPHRPPGLKEGGAGPASGPLRGGCPGPKEGEDSANAPLCMGHLRACHHSQKSTNS